MALRPYSKRGRFEAGCDEAGRGCLAGPVCAAAVILPDKFDLPGLHDSKQLTPEQRAELRVLICEQALGWAVAMVPPAQIDKINILQASILAMHRALDKLEHRIDFILVDGGFFKPYKSCPHKCIIKGDATFASIAAASILAKTARDAVMESLHDAHPQYRWLTNKGYATVQHREAIIEHGTTEHHRMSFRLFPEETNQLEIWSVNTQQPLRLSPQSDILQQKLQNDNS